MLKADRPLAIAWWVALGLRGLLPAGRDLYYDYYEPDDAYAQRCRAELAAADRTDVVAALLAALDVAKRTLYAWHQIGMGDDEAWLIYNAESPEMKQINAAIQQARLED